METVNHMIDSNQVSQAKKKLKNLPKSTWRDGEVLFAFHLIEFIQKNYRMALFYLNKIENGKRYKRKKNITQTKVAIAKISTLQKMGNKQEEIIKVCKNLIKYDSKDVFALEIIAENFFQMRNEGAAKPYLLEAKRLNTKRSKVYVMLTHLQLKDKNYEDAYDAIEKAILFKSEKNCRLMELRLEVLYYLSRYQEVISYEQKIDESYRRSMKTRAYTALAHFRLRNYKEAFVQFNKFLEKHINDFGEEIIEARYAYSQLLAREQKHEQALQQLVMIERGNKEYLDTTERRSLYEIFFSNKDLNAIVLKNSMKHAEKFYTALIAKNFAVQESYQNSAVGIVSFLLHRKKIRKSGEMIVLVTHSKPYQLEIRELRDCLKNTQIAFKRFGNPSLLMFTSFYPITSDQKAMISGWAKKTQVVFGVELVSAIENKTLLGS